MVRSAAIILLLCAAPLEAANAAEQPSNRDVSVALIISVTGGMLRNCGIYDFKRQIVFQNYVVLRGMEGATPRELAVLKSFWGRYISAFDRSLRSEKRDPCDNDIRWRALESRRLLEAGRYPE